MKSGTDREFVAPPLLGRGFSKFEPRQLQFMLWNSFNVDPSPFTNYSSLLDEVKNRVASMEVDERDYRDLKKEVDRLVEGRPVPESTLATGEDSKKARRRESRLKRKAAKLGISYEELLSQTETKTRSNAMSKEKLSPTEIAAATSQPETKKPKPNLKVVKASEKVEKKKPVAKKKSEDKKKAVPTKKPKEEVAKKAAKLKDKKPKTGNRLPKKPEVKRDRKNRPDPSGNSLGAKIWAICDKENKKKGGAVRANVLEVCDKKEFNRKTASTIWQRWKRKNLK